MTLTPIDKGRPVSPSTRWRVPRAGADGREGVLAGANHRARSAALQRLLGDLGGLDLAAAAEGGGQVHLGGRAGFMERIDMIELIDRFLRDHDLRGSKLEFARGTSRHEPPPPGVLIAPHGPNSPAAVNPSLLLASLDAGATAILQGLAHHDDGLGALVEDVETVFRTRCGLNVYLSAVGARGFGEHWDDHDLVIIQLDGAKEWEVFMPSEPHPTPGHTSPAIGTQPAWSGVLEKGDVLYLPRGHGHRTRTVHGLSAHASLWIRPPTGIEIAQFVSTAASSSPALRASVPVNTERYACSIDSELRGLVEAADVQAGVAQWRAKVPSRARTALSALSSFDRHHLSRTESGPLALRLSAPGGFVMSADGAEIAFAERSYRLEDPALDWLGAALDCSSKSTDLALAVPALGPHERDELALVLLEAGVLDVRSVVTGPPR